LPYVSSPYISFFLAMQKPVFPRKRLATVAAWSSAPGLQKPKRNPRHIEECRKIKKEYKRALAKYYEQLRQWRLGKHEVKVEA